MGGEEQAMKESNENTRNSLCSFPSTGLLEWEVDLEVFDPLQNRRVEKSDVIEARSEKNVYSEVCWKFGDTAEIKRISLL